MIEVATFFQLSILSINFICTVVDFLFRLDNKIVVLNRFGSLVIFSNLLQPWLA